MKIYMLPSTRLVAGGPRKNLVPNDICGGLHLRHMAIPHECHGWVAGEFRVSTVWGPQEHVSPKTVRSYWDLSNPKGLLV
jgi:hypothetical protein